MNKHTFYKSTKAIFKGCKTPSRKPDHISYDSYGNVSSRYWYFDDGVIRESNHWSEYRSLNDGIKRDFAKKAEENAPRRGYGWQSQYNRCFNATTSSNNNFKGCGWIASCKWSIKTNSNKIESIINNDSKNLAGFAKWLLFKTV